MDTVQRCKAPVQTQPDWSLIRLLSYDATLDNRYADLDPSSSPSKHKFLQQLLCLTLQLANCLHVVPALHASSAHRFRDPSMWMWSGVLWNVMVNVKSVPLQAWSGPEGSRKLRFPGFVTTAQGGGMVVSFTHRPHLPLGNPPGTHFC